MRSNTAIIEGRLAWMQHSPNLEERGFGEKRGDKLFLHPVEVAYLVLKGGISVIWEERRAGVLDVFRWAVSHDQDFLPFFFAYEDLRERGKKVKPSDGFLIGKEVFLPLSERKEVTIPWLFGIKMRFEGLILAVVDEECEVTYYRVRDVEMKGNQRERIGGIKGYFIKDRVLTENTKIFREFFYGNERNGIVSLSLVESLYLVEKGAMDVYANKKLDFKEIKELGCAIEGNFMRRYEVYRDLKMRGFVVKTGFKFGSDFRVYEEVKSVDDLPHSKYLVAVADNRKMPMYEIARAVRLAHNVRKKMLFAFKTDENRWLMIERVRV
jgi:tRNA-intron endonuclease